MLVIELGFPAGRYHATPWGRHVNEGAVEWPPSPFRLARALVDAWGRRRPDWERERVEAVVRPLSGTPVFSLPPATTSHTRSYLSGNDKDRSKKALVFDAFVALRRDTSVRVGFDGTLDDSARRDLHELLGELNYLGRSESWAWARLVDDAGDTVWNCGPVGHSAAGGDGEAVEVGCLRSPEEYERLPYLPRRKVSGRRRKGDQNPAPPLPWFDALCLSTAELQKDGWSAPPALLPADYVRQADALEPAPVARATPRTPVVREAHYALAATVRPKVTETVAVAEQVRIKLMGIHRRVMGGDHAAVSPRFSGKAPDGRPARGHGHMYVLPMDADGDGYLDRLVVRVREPFDREELTALDRLVSLWQGGSRPDVRLVLTALREDLGDTVADRWVSATPFVTRRHHRRGRGPLDAWLADEVRRECGNHGLPVPVSVEWTRATPNRGHAFPWYEFQRSRRNERPLRGHGCVLTFGEPVRGPFSVGALAHYGLGQFVVAGERQVTR